MPSKTQHKIQFAAKRGIEVYYVDFPESVRQFRSGWYVGQTKAPYNEFGPYLSKRQAKNVAYSLAVGQENVV